MKIRDSVYSEGPAVRIDLSIDPLLSGGLNGVIFWNRYECEIIGVDSSRRSRMRLMEVIDCLIGMGQIAKGFPSPFVTFRVSFPFD